MSKRVVDMKVLKGEPTDGTGRTCIHLFVRDERGPIVEPYVLHQAVENGEPVKQKLEPRPTRGRLACDPKKTVAPVTRGKVTTITQRTDDPRAVTCTKCKESADYVRLIGLVEA